MRHTTHLHHFLWVCVICSYTKTMSFEVFDARLRTPFSAVVAGPSMCGKTQFVLKLLESWNTWVDSQFDYIVWSYGQKTEALEKIKKIIW